VIRETFPVGLLQCNCTVLGDELSHEAIVVDPGDDLAHILSVLRAHQLQLRRILVTHAHIDHIAGAQALKGATGAPIFYNQQDLPLVAMMATQASWFGLEVPVVSPPDHSPVDGERFGVNGIDGELLHVPGHTPGSLVLYVPAQKLLIAGDTLFAGGIGRGDFPFGNGAQLVESIRDVLLPLPGETLVVPGHGPETTIADEQATNPFLQRD
jgi:hydroxyacylglutathione hydrolase